MRSLTLGSAMNELPSSVRRVLSLLLPGVLQLLRGSVASGGFVIFLWLGMLWIPVVRWERMLSAFSGPWDHRLALTAWIVTVALVLAWSFAQQGGERAATPGESRSQLSLAWNAFLKSRVAVGAAMTVAVFYLIALE